MNSRSIAVLYAALAAVWVVLIATLLPPVQAPDEGEHLVRADQICRGHPVAARFSQNATGGVIDLGMIEAINRFYPLLDKVDARVDAAMFAPISWGKASLWNFPNTSLYPPFLYLPAAVSLCVGKASGLDVLNSTLLARIAMGLVSVSIAVAGVFLAGSAAPWLFALLTLPSSIGLMACVTQDGPMIALTALSVGLVTSLQTHGAHPRLRYLGLCLILALLGTARPPYAALVLLLMTPRAVPLAARLIGSALTFLVIAAWWGFCKTHILVSVDRTAGVNAAAQLSAILSHPWRVPSLLVATMKANFLPDYAGYFITTFSPPNTYTLAAWVILAVSAACTVRSKGVLEVWTTVLVVIGTGAAAACIFAIQYLTWTRLNAPVVDGVMARYFIPLAIATALAWQPLDRKPDRVGRHLVKLVLFFPVFSMVVTIHAIVDRFRLI